VGYTYIYRAEHPVTWSEHDCGDRFDTSAFWPDFFDGRMEGNIAQLTGFRLSCFQIGGLRWRGSAGRYIRFRSRSSLSETCAHFPTNRRCSVLPTHQRQHSLTVACHSFSLGAPPSVDTFRRRKTYELR
jgi:hypothetical protein